MKITPSTTGPRSPHRRERGFAFVVVLALLAILLIYVNGNMRALHGLDQELKLTERQQVKRLNALSATNAPASPRPAAANARSVSMPAPTPAP
jgi:hypothetical protein